MSRLLATMLVLAPALFAQGAGSIEGRIVSSITGEGIGGVETRFLDSREHVFKTTTDASGAFRIAGLPDGDFRGEFSHEGFARSGSEPLHVAGSVAARVQGQLDPWGVLHGRVLDEDGTPAAKIEVRLGAAPSVTDEKGVFQFTDLPPGSFPLAAYPQPKIRTVEGVRLGTVAIYYPSATDITQAIPIQIRKGTDLSGVEIRLRSVPVHRVAGIVRDPAGKPAAKASVKLLGKPAPGRQSLGYSLSFVGGRAMNNFTITGPGPEEEFARVESKEDGTFEFTAVESGDWRLIATRGVEEDMPLAAVAPALVSVRDIEGVELRLTESFEIGVTASWGEQKAPEWAARATNLVSLFPVEEQPRLFFDPEQYPGEIFGVFPGRYRVRPYSFSGGFYPAAVMWEGRDVNGQVVEIAPGAAPFQVVYRADSGTLRGTVESSGEKGQGGTVMLTPRDPGEVTFFRQEPVGAGGAFAFTGVPPGDYYVVAFDRADTRDLPLGEIPSAIVPIATSVRIESAGSASVDLRLNRWFW